MPRGPRDRRQHDAHVVDAALRVREVAEMVGRADLVEQQRALEVLERLAQVALVLRDQAQVVVGGGGALVEMPRQLRCWMASERSYSGRARSKSRRAMCSWRS
jgi:hypothetical protein